MSAVLISPANQSLINNKEKELAEIEKKIESLEKRKEIIINYLKELRESNLNTSLDGHMQL